MFHNSINLGFAVLYPFDIIYLIISIIVVISTSLEGFANSVSKHAGVVIGLAMGFIFAGPLTSFLSRNIDISKLWLTYISYITIIVISFISIKVLGYKLNVILDESGLDVVDTTLGIFYGLFEALVICLAIHVLLINQGAIDIQPEYNFSKLVQYILDPVSKTVLPYLGEIIHVY